MFNAIGEKTLYIFGISNAITLPMVWALYPESNQRTLEEMDLLFAADTPWNWDAERNFALLKEQNPDLVQAAKQRQSVVSAEDGLMKVRSKPHSNAVGSNGEMTQQVEYGDAEVRAKGL